MAQGAPPAQRDGAFVAPRQDAAPALPVEGPDDARQPAAAAPSPTEAREASHLAEAASASAVSYLASVALDDPSGIGPELPASRPEVPFQDEADFMELESERIASDAPAAVSEQAKAAPPPVAAQGAGWRIIIPQIGVDAPIVSVGLDSAGAMGVPRGPDEVGWYQYGPRPGQPGNVLLGGHVDWTDRQTGIPHGAVFWYLAKVPLGGEITITDGQRTYTYVVFEKRRYQWEDPAGVSVLQPTSDSRITVITCGGVFDRATRDYSMREVVIARLVH